MKSKNRLAQHTSQYLLQHAGSPVDWYPWDAEAVPAAATFALQRLRCLLAENKYPNAPILIILRDPKKSIRQWQHYVLNIYKPYVAVYMIGNIQENLPDSLVQPLTGDKPFAYICEDMPPLKISAASSRLSTNCKPTVQSV